MKSTTLRLLSAALAATLVSLGLSAQTPRPNQTVVITPPAVKDGSNQSRAPFPAARTFNDFKGPDGQAVDLSVPPNTPATNPETNPIPPARVAIFQPRAPAEPTVQPLPGEPMLAMTGRPSVGLATSLDAARLVPAIREDSFASRDQVAADVEARLNSSDQAMKTMHESMKEMSAENRAQFKSVADDVKEKEKAVRKSLRAARKANEQNWEAARQALAADYESFAAAAAQVDAAAGIAPLAR